MAKSLSSFWLNSIKRMGKAQQAQGRKLFKSLVPQAVRSPPVRPGKAIKAVQVIKPGLKTTGPQAIKRNRPAAAASSSPIPDLPGTWQKSYFSPSPLDSRPGETRRMLYQLYLPSGAPSLPAASMPLVVMLHGCQQTAADFAVATRMNRLAERKGFAVLYPQQSAALDSHRCWHWYQRSIQQGSGEVRLVADLIVQVQLRHGLDGSRTYVAGLSAGAALAAIVALRHPDLIAAAGLHSAPVFGTVDSPISAYRAMQQGSGRSWATAANDFIQAQPAFPGMPVILIHGQRDAVVRRVNLDQLSQQFAIINAARLTRAEPVMRGYPARLGGRSPRHAYQTATYYAGRKPHLLRCEIDALGHAWSGGARGEAFSAPEGPDATLMMWEFFKNHRRAPAGTKA